MPGTKPDAEAVARYPSPLELPSKGKAERVSAAMPTHTWVPVMSAMAGRGQNRTGPRWEPMPSLVPPPLTSPLHLFLAFASFPIAG